MATTLNPYLQFAGTAREAMTFYADVLGGEASFSTFAEFGMGEGPQSEQIMHSQIEVDGVAILMASDSPEDIPTPQHTNPAISLFGGQEDAEAIRRQWNQLAEGGTVLEPLVVAPWGDEFGMVNDRFGVLWMVNIAARQS